MDNFLQNPASYPKIRDWLKIRMPTFGFTDEESDALVRYFKKIAGVNTLLEETPVRLNPEMIAAGKALMGPDNFQCASCHIINGVRPAAGPTVWAPDLAYGHGRLRPQFINKWVRDPAKLSPGIRMPGYYPEGGQGPAGILGGDVEKQVEAIVDYIMYLGGYGNAVTEGGSANTTETQPETKPAAPSESAPQASL
jgi:mono/diheme cytochrome c family protein